MDPYDSVLDPMFYMDDTRRAANTECPKCKRKDKTVVAFGARDILVVYYGCRLCRFRWIQS